MPGQLHPQLLHGRNLAVPSDQQKILDKQTVARAPGHPHFDVPPAVHDSIKACYLRNEERKKRDAHEARLQDQARVSKLQKQRHERGDRPLSPPTRRASTPAQTPAPSPSPGSAVSWSPSPDRTKRTTVQVSTPTRLSPPAFPSSVPEEPLEVQLPQANTELEDLPTTSQAGTPPQRRDVRNTGTPPCGQPSQPATGTPASGGKRANRFKAHAFNWSASASQYDEVGRQPMDYKLSERVPPYRSLLPPSSNRPNIPPNAPDYGSSLPSSSNKTSNVPPPGQTVPHPGWPAPRQYSPLKEMVHVESTPSVESEEIVASAERPTQANFQLSLSGSQMPLAQTMSYLSPDMASQSPAQQVEQLRFTTGSVSAQEAQLDGVHMLSQASQPNDPLTGVRSAVLSCVQNERLSGEQQQTQASLKQPEPPTAKLPDVVGSSTGALPGHRQGGNPAVYTTGSGPRLEDRLSDDPTQSNGAEAADDSQEASTVSALSTTSATQQPVKLSIAFDHVTPFDTFCKVYKEYTGDIEAFVIACMCLKYVWDHKLLHSSLWDDFVGHFPLYQARVAKGRKRDQLPAGEWYNDRDEEATFTKKLIDKSNLARILSYYGSVVQKLERRIHNSPRKQHLNPTEEGNKMVPGDRKPPRAHEEPSPKQSQERMKQTLISAVKSNATVPSGDSTLRNSKSPSPSRIVILDSQSDQGDETLTNNRNSPKESPAISTKRVSEDRSVFQKPTETHAKRSSASRNDVVARSPAGDKSPAKTRANHSSAARKNAVVSDHGHVNSLASAEPISEAQRMAQEALQIDRLDANRLATPFPPQINDQETAPWSSMPNKSEATPSSSRPSSTSRRTTRGPITAAQRKAMMSFQKPSKGRSKGNKEGAKLQDAGRRTSSLTKSDAS